MSPRNAYQSVPNFTAISNDESQPLRPFQVQNQGPNRQIRHRMSSLSMGISDLGLNLDQNTTMNLGAVPASFATQMALATGGLKGLRGNSVQRQQDTENMMGRLMLARMKTLEEGFAEVVKEFREMRTGSSVEGGEGPSGGYGGVSAVERRKGKAKETEKEKEKEKGRVGRREGPGVVVRAKNEVEVTTLASKANDDPSGITSPRAEVADTNPGDNNLLAPAGEIIERFITKGSSF